MTAVREHRRDVRSEHLRPSRREREEHDGGSHSVASAVPPAPGHTVTLRNTRPEDFDGIIELTRRIYPHSVPWTHEQLAAHRHVFPEGQFVAVAGERVVGMAASLIVFWDDYDFQASWRDFTGGGTFANHDPEHGRTLYAAEVMVDPNWRGCGIGGRLYEARRELAIRLGLLRIRAGARLRGYHRHAGQLTPAEYVERVESGELHDPTLSFQFASRSGEPGLRCSHRVAESGAHRNRNAAPYVDPCA
jgi:GNAT superfamily N-acetyltransferase